MTSEKTGAPILIVGSMAFDDLDLPTGSERDVVGGSATYASLAASLLAPARVVAVVGDDFPGAVLERLTAKGIDIAGIERARGKTFRWAGRYAHNLASRTTLDTQLNVFADFRPTLPDSYKSSPIVFLGNIHPALQLEVLGQTTSPRFVAADTMNFWIEGERSALGDVLKKIDALVINDEELRQLAQEHNVSRAARRVRALGPKRLIVKRGEYGAMLFDEQGTFFAPAFPLEDEIDPTGAGDTFAGALLGHLAQAKTIDHDSLRRALLFAAAVASFCVEDVGTRRLERLTREDVTSRLDLLHRLTLVPS
jgi:sugar/nucleoside kinase (ribokinase family)